MIEALAIGLLAIVLVASSGESEAEIVGRVITSEAGGYTQLERLAVGYTVLNMARKRKKTIAQLAEGVHPQYNQATHRVYPFSTAKKATKENVALGKQILAAYPAGDPTHGGTSFFEPAAQDAALASGVAGYKYDAQALRDKWTAEGMSKTGSVGRWEFYA